MVAQSWVMFFDDFRLFFDDFLFIDFFIDFFFFLLFSEISVSVSFAVCDDGADING